MKRAALLAAALIVHGCAPAPVYPLYTSVQVAGSFYMISAQLASFIQSDKLPFDYLAEFASGKECRSIAAMRDGGPLCRDSFDEPRIYEKPIYCYRTIGTITCYSEPDPYKTNAEPVR